MKQSNIPNFLIIQIYEFVKARPGVSKKNNLNLIIEYLRELHKGQDLEFRIIEPLTVIGNFGKVKRIVIKLPPDFMDKEAFLKWLNKKIN